MLYPLRSRPVSPDSHSQIDEMVYAIRSRMRYGMTKKEIIDDLSRFITQDELFLCYASAAIMERDYGRKEE